VTVPALEGKVAIVTGASAGIGRAYALALAGAGATVVAAARTLGRTDGGTPEHNSLAEVAGLVDETATKFDRIDILVNNAGIMARHRPFEVDTDEWDRIMRVNVRGPYLTIRDVAPHMIRQGSGSIVNVTALAAAFLPKGDRAQGSVVYAVSKAALNRLSFYMAEELKPHGIAVNALSPGVVRTDTALVLNPKAGPEWGKPATPEVLGPALIHLAQQTAATLTGQVLHTDEFGESWP